jgi:hypothetical protein
MARVLYRAFGAILEQYDVPEGFTGPVYPWDFDFMKFQGHELFTMLAACLIREERWELVSELLAAPIPVKYQRRENGPGSCSFDDISAPINFVHQLSQERQRISVRADILKARHVPERALGKIISIDDFVAADYFLFLRGELAPEAAPSDFLAWAPWSTLFMKGAPRFIRDAESAAVARRLAVALGIPDVLMLRERLTQRAGRIKQLWRSGFWDQPLRQVDIDRIGYQA